jgi:D-alanyl-D-alanine carboxypeptidase/D-alanyl-D-alanine-endopeptidase (penicillin-binding protein 4)
MLKTAHGVANKPDYTAWQSPPIRLVGAHAVRGISRKKRVSLGVSIAVTLLGAGLWGNLRVQGDSIPVLPADPIVETAMSQYLSSLSAAYLPQGVWLQSDRAVLAEHQGAMPLPVASLTKIATSLAALHAWGPAYQFMTLISVTGPIRDGVLHGDLVVQGGGDPFFITEDALELRHDLWELGLRRVTGKLVIIGDFYMNFSTNPAVAGKLLKHAFYGTERRVVRMIKGKRGNLRSVVTHAPPSGASVSIAGPVEVTEMPLTRQSLVMRHRSLPVVQILKRMNVHSNNAMANMLTETLGGPQRMVREAALGAGIAAEELRLSNGSGLGIENQLAPRTVCALLVGIQRALLQARMTIADVFPVAGYDLGTIRRRNLPLATVVKTGTLRNVSTLAGVMLTRRHGPVWFALINQGNDIGGFREHQDAFLQALMQHWGAMEYPPQGFSPTGTWTKTDRNDILMQNRAHGG